METIGTRSDILIHWTGRQFDRERQGDLSPQLRSDYIERLRSLYRHGILFGAQPADVITGVGGIALTLPNPPNVCFTELRPQHSVAFCRQYGRMGIGLDRVYLLSKGANPVLYLQNSSEGIVNTNFVTLGSALQLLASRAFPIPFAYIKPMSREASNLALDYYEEHEWRVVLPGPLTTERGESLPLPPEFAVTTTESGQRRTFRFISTSVRLLLLPDERCVEVALTDPFLQEAWSDYQPQLVALPRVLAAPSSPNR